MKILERGFSKIGIKDTKFLQPLLFLFLMLPIHLPLPSTPLDKCVPHSACPFGLNGTDIMKKRRGRSREEKATWIFHTNTGQFWSVWGHSELLGVAYRVKWRGMDMPVETLWAVWNCEGTSFVWQRNVPPNSPTLREIKEV